MDYEQMELESETENLESVLDFVDDDSIFPVSHYRMWSSLLENRYVVEDVVTQEANGDYLLRHILHALLDSAEGTVVCSFLHHLPVGDEAGRADAPVMLLMYSPSAMLSYCHYCGRALELDAVASAVGSAVGPQMTYWIDDAGEQVCLQCKGGFMLGAVRMEGPLVMTFGAFMPESRLSLPRHLWPAEVAPYADLMCRVTNSRDGVPGKVLRADRDAVLEAILAFVEPLKVLKRQRVKRKWEDLWVWMLDFPQVWDYVARPLGGKLFNPNSIAHILSLMNEMEVVDLQVKSRVVKLLPEVNENFRTNLSSPPSDRVRGVLKSYLRKVV